MIKMGDFFFINDVFVSDIIQNEAREAVEQMVPPKSKSLYVKLYLSFCDWRKKESKRG